MNTSRIRKPVAKKITASGKRRQLVGARLDEDDGAGRADQPHQRALQREHAGRSMSSMEESPRLSPHTPSHTLTQ